VLLLWYRFSTVRSVDRIYVLSEGRVVEPGTMRNCWRPGDQVSGRGESHPPALAEPGVRVSPHRAPTGRPWVRAMRCQWTKSLGWR
jgi:hypothetical protein